MQVKSLIWLFLLTFSIGIAVTAQPLRADDAAPAADETTETTTDEAADDDTAATTAANPPGWNDGDLVSDLPLADSNAYTINTLIMFVCAVLVLFMQAGFAMVEVGLNAAKNTVNILFKNVMDLSVGVLLFIFIGYSLMYPSETIFDGYLGMPTAFISRDAQVDDKGTPDDDSDDVWAVAPTYSDGAYASNGADFLFQVAFAATAATIVSGAVAGRMKFGAYLVYSAVLTGLIYPISGYWKWGGGFLDQMGFHDFAGSVVVHAVGGFAGLAGALALGPRLGRYTSDGKSVPIPGHNIAFAALGVFILWIGWYGFNPGSQLTYSGAINAEATAYIAVTTTISAAAGAVAAMVLAWALFGKPDVTMALNGALAGLVGITANCDQVSQFSALIIGLVSGLLVVAGIIALDKLKIDDPVGAFPVHGICGVWGGIATGIFGTAAGVSLWTQCVATLIICVWAFSTMGVLFFAMKAIGVLRVSPEEEGVGLDISEHGMHAYPSELAGSPA